MNARFGLRASGLTAVVGLVASADYVAGCAKGATPESVQVVLQAASSTGESPWTESISSATAPTVLPSTAATSSAVPSADDGHRSVSGDQIGLYGGTPNSPVCHPDKMVSFLAGHPDKANAFKDVSHTDDIPNYFRGLAPVVATTDIRVTNHGYNNGVTTFQSVLQKGTALLIDRVGVPRVRCACGNPLSEPMALTPAVKQNFVGDSWNGFDAGEVVVVDPAPAPVKEFVLADVSNGPAEPNAAPPPILAIAPGETVPTVAPPRGAIAPGETVPTVPPPTMSPPRIAPGETVPTIPPPR